MINRGSRPGRTTPTPRQVGHFWTGAGGSLFNRRRQPAGRRGASAVCGCKKAIDLNLSRGRGRTNAGRNRCRAPVTPACLPDRGRAGPGQPSCGRPSRARVRYWCGKARGGPWSEPASGSYRQAGWRRARLPARGGLSASAGRVRSDSSRPSRAVGYSRLLRVAHGRRLVAGRRCVAEQGCSGGGRSSVTLGKPVGRCVQAGRRQAGCLRLG
jgi:hypothetical protein